MTAIIKPQGKWPLYAKLSITCMGLLSFFFIMVLGKDIIFPVLLSIIIAILLNPLVNLLIRWHFHRILAISICVVGAIIGIFGISYLIFTQAADLSDHFPEFKNNFLQVLKNLIHWTSLNLHVDEAKIDAWAQELKIDGISNSNRYMGVALQSISGVLILIMLLPVYIFLLLLYKPMLLEFISKVFKDDKKNEIEILANTDAMQIVRNKKLASAG